MSSSGSAIEYEKNFAEWVAASAVLYLGGLVQFHLFKVHGYADKTFAKLICASLIAISVSLTLVALVSYDNRVVSNNDDNAETIYMGVYTGIIIWWFFIQASSLYYIINAIR